MLNILSQFLKSFHRCTIWDRSFMYFHDKKKYWLFYFSDFHLLAGWKLCDTSLEDFIRLSLKVKLLHLNLRRLLRKKLFFSPPKFRVIFLYGNLLCMINLILKDSFTQNMTYSYNFKRKILAFFHFIGLDQRLPTSL